MRKIRTALTVAVATAAAVVTLPGATATAAPTWDRCVQGNVCFFTGSNGTGSICSWSVADPDWTQGAIKCSWSQTDEVKSVWNRGTSSSYTGVAYYQWANYTTRKGCTRQGARGNLAGTYMLKSHRWVDGNCG